MIRLVRGLLLLFKKKPTGRKRPVGNTASYKIYLGITLDACGPFCPILFSNSTS